MNETKDQPEATWLRLSKRFRRRPMFEWIPDIHEGPATEWSGVSTGRDVHLVRGLLALAVGAVPAGVLVYMLHADEAGFLAHAALAFMAAMCVGGGVVCLLQVRRLQDARGGVLVFRHGYWPFVRRTTVPADALTTRISIVPNKGLSFEHASLTALQLVHRCCPDRALRLCLFRSRRRVQDLLDWIEQRIGDTLDDRAVESIDLADGTTAEVDRLALRAQAVGSILTTGPDGIAKVRAPYVWLLLTGAFGLLGLVFLALTLRRLVTSGAGGPPWECLVPAAVLLAIPLLHAVYLLRCRFVLDRNDRSIRLGAGSTLPDGARVLSFDDIAAVQCCWWSDPNDEGPYYPCYELNLVVRHYPWHRATVYSRRSRQKTLDNGRRLAELLDVPFLDHSVDES